MLCLCACAQSGHQTSNALSIRPLGPCSNATGAHYYWSRKACKALLVSSCSLAMRHATSEPGNERNWRELDVDERGSGRDLVFQVLRRVQVSPSPDFFFQVMIMVTIVRPPCKQLIGSLQAGAWTWLQCTWFDAQLFSSSASQASRKNLEKLEDRLGGAPSMPALVPVLITLWKTFPRTVARVHCHCPYSFLRALVRTCLPFPLQSVGKKLRTLSS